ncbi:MAG: M1 family aminopeptidase [Candidatus Cloacimonadaceae bacterium]|nr:M1 family aminopeptidase [Candidatus Cloacimonadaceae bacterium]
MKARSVALLIFAMLTLGAIAGGGLHAMQPFWSMDPSLRGIERADSLTGFDITKYVINLAVDDVTRYVNGSIEAFVTAEEDLSQIDYRLEGGTLAVTEVRVNGVVSPFSHGDGIVNIPLAFTQGTVFSTLVSYSGVPGSSPSPYNIGLKFTTNGIHTLSNPEAGRYWWPCYDHPWDKALVDWNITLRSDWLAAANGTRSGITDNGDGTRTHHWSSADPIATFVIGFAAAPYVEFLQQAGDLPIQNFVLAGQLANAQVDFANVPEMIDYFSGLFGPYPFEKYGHMVVNMSTYAAMEHQTMTTFGAQYLTGNQNHETIVAHELAHQWYGNLITPIHMGQAWLKESFATYSEALWTHHKLGWESACAYIRSDIQQYYLSWENSNGPHTIYNPPYNLMFAPPTYEKSASVLHMLRLKLGNEDFFAFIRALLTTYKDGNYDTADFIALAEQISGQDLSQFFLQWIYSPGVPNARLSVFTDGWGMAKVIAKTISPTATDFYIEIPLSLPGSAVADSVVVNASPQGAVNYFAIGAQDDYSSILIDPNNWVLTRQLSKIDPVLATCLPYNSAVALSWNALDCGAVINGYRVYRRALPDGDFVGVNPVLITGLSYTDTSVQNGIEYQYRICAVDDEGYISTPSNVMNARPISFPFDAGFLVVDETRDGNGNAISPTDQMADDFYSYVLQDFGFSQWDFATDGEPTLELLSHHPLVLWHCDDFSEMLLIDHLDLIGSYVLSGGRLIISGWKYPSVFTTDFLNVFLPGITPTYHNSAVLLSVQGNGYPTLIPDPAKLAGAWNGMLPMSYTFPGAQNAIYNAQILNEGEGHGYPAAITVQKNGYLALLGFPLYFMMQEEVRAFMAEFIPDFFPGICDGDPNAKALLSCYPNPFGGASGLHLKLENATAEKVEIYNVKGQKLLSLDDFSAVKHRAGQVITLEPALFAGYPSACYLIRVKTEKGYASAKAVLLK